MEPSKREKLNGLADIFDTLAKLCRSEFCESVNESAIDSVTDVAKKALDIGIGYKSIERMTGKGYNTIASIAHRDGMKATITKTFPFSWVIEKFKVKL